MNSTTTKQPPTAGEIVIKPKDIRLHCAVDPVAHDEARAAFAVWMAWSQLRNSYPEAARALRWSIRYHALYMIAAAKKAAMASAKQNAYIESVIAGCMT